MKKLIVITLYTFVIHHIAFAQEESTFNSSKLKEIENNMQLVWNDPDADFKVSSIPEKWKDESGVIIAQKTRFAFDKDKNKLAVYEITHRRIKLNDHDAVNSYSSIYFRIGSSHDGAGIKVIKSNGTVQDVSIKDALLIENLGEVPATFQPYIGKAATRYDRSKSEVIFYKLAIPDLDPGDIIDYGTIFYDDNTVKKMSYIEFDPIYFICTREYPVLSQKFEIDTDDNSFVNSKAINGAPEFKETPNSSVDYTWEDRNRERVTDVRWVNNYVDLPLVKFQIVFSRKENRSDLFIGDRGELKRSISPEELAKKTNSIYDKIDASAILGMTQYYLKQINYADIREEDFISKLYYIIRHISYLRMNGNMPSDLFAYCFMKKLDLRKIPYDLIVTSPSSLTKPGDIIFKRETEWIVRVKNKYVFAPTVFSNPYDFKQDFQHVDAFVITLGKNPTATPVSLPDITAVENATTTQITASLDSSLQVVNVTSQETVKGLSKQLYNLNALIYTTALDDDYRSYGGDDDIRTSLKGSILESYEDKLRERKKEDKTRKLEYMKKVMEDDFDNVLNYDEFVLNSDGRNLRKQDLIYTNRFELGEMVHKAGKNLLVSIPKLIGGQRYISQEERTREYDADMGFARELVNEISFSIPDGYKVVGLNNLVMNVENEVGAFTSTAKLEGNQLKLSVRKVYKKVIIKKDEWNKMLAFLDTAFNFSQRKVLLKRL